MTKRTRVAIVAPGAVTALGPTAADLWEGAQIGQVAIADVDHIPMDELSTKIAGEAKHIPGTFDYDRPEGFTERALDLALAAARESIAALADRAIDPERFGMVFSTCNAGLISGREWLRARSQGNTPDPRLATLVTPQGLAEAVAAEIGLRGPIISVNTACASGAGAIGIAADLLRSGKADAILTGGSDALSDIAFAGFNSLQSLSPEPAAPYSGNRQGLSLGEGGAFMILMSSELAAECGLTPLAEVAGYGLSADGYNPTAPRPDGSGAANAIRGALTDAGVTAADVGYVNGHGTGTPKNDSAETNAIKRALGDQAYAIPVSSTKSLIGHLLGAAGAAEAIVTAHAVATGIAPPTAGFLTRDPECDLDYVPQAPKDFPQHFALSNNFAFGGANASVLFARAGAEYQVPAKRDHDVVITGIGAVTPAGLGVEALADAIASGSARWHDTQGRPVGTVTVDPDQWLPRRARRRMDRLSIYSVLSAAEALRNAGIAAMSEDSAKVGVLFGTGVGPMEAMERFCAPLFTDGAAAADPGWFPNTVYNQAAGQVSTHLGMFGATSTLSVGHATGAAALVYGAELIRHGHAEALAVTLTDMLTEEVIHAYQMLGLLRAEDGGPGFGLSEASVTIVIERRGDAIARGATVLGSVVGTGSASDCTPRRSEQDEAAAVERAIRAAFDDAGISAGDVDNVWSAAAGMTFTDNAETTALRGVFGPTQPKLFEPKKLIGEPLGVGAALCLALSLADPSVTGTSLITGTSLGGTHHCLIVSKGDN